MMKTALKPYLNLIGSHMPEYGASVNVNEANVVTKTKVFYESLVKDKTRYCNPKCMWKNLLHLSNQDNLTSVCNQKIKMI